MKELEELDPVSVRRATTFFPTAPQPPADEEASLIPATKPPGK
jgi:hypothetical protein